MRIIKLYRRRIAVRIDLQSSFCWFFLLNRSFPAKRDKLCLRMTGRLGLVKVMSNCTKRKSVVFPTKEESVGRKHQLMLNDFLNSVTSGCIAFAKSSPSWWMKSSQSHVGANQSQRLFNCSISPALSLFILSLSAEWNSSAEKKWLE